MGSSVPTDPSDARIDDVPSDGSSPLRASATAIGLGVLGPLLAVLLVGVVAAVDYTLGLPFLVLLGLSLLLGQYVAFAGLAIAYLSYRGLDGDGMRSYFGVELPSLRDLGLVVGGWLVIFGMLVVISLVIQFLDLQPGANQTAVVAMENPAIIPMLVAVMFLVVAPCEEILYRGVVQGRLREALPAAPSIAIASAIFALIHVMALTGGISARLMAVFFLFFPSLVFGAVYEYTENLVVPILLHGLHNSIILAFLWISVTYGEAVAAIAA